MFCVLFQIYSTSDISLYLNYLTYNKLRKHYKEYYEEAYCTQPHSFTDYL